MITITANEDTKVNDGLAKSTDTLTSSRNQNRDRSNSRGRSSSSSDSDNEYHCIQDHSKMPKFTPSSEILIAMPDKKGSKRYTTYLGLVDSGASGSLVNKELVKYADFDIKWQKKPTKWDTATGVFQTSPFL